MEFRGMKVFTEPNMEAINRRLNSWADQIKAAGLDPGEHLQPKLTQSEVTGESGEVHGFYRCAVYISAAALARIRQ
jgi:hypothetical protein